MTIQTKTIGRLPQNKREWDPNYVNPGTGQRGYGQKFRVFQYGCELESKIENNTYEPFSWDGDQTFVLDVSHWELCSGNPKVWAAGNPKPATTGTTGDYPYNGMGRVVIPKNMVNIAEQGEPENIVNLLAQDAFEDGEGNPLTDTVFVIRYDFTLGEDITVPADCVLEFDGGSLDGVNDTYTLTGNNTVIAYNSYNILKGIQVAGTFANDSVVIDIFDDMDWADKMSKSVYVSRTINMSKNSSYTQTTTLTMDDKYWGAHINGNGSVITCNVANSIVVNGYVQFVKFEHVFINTTVSTGIGIDLQHPSGANYQIRHFNIDNVYLKGFRTGIKLNTVRSTTISRLYVDAECCILYTGKSANVFIKDSIFYCNNVSNDNCCGILSNADGDDYPEGLSVSNVCFYGFAKPLYITDIFVLNVYSCFFDVRMVDGVDTHNMIKIEKNKKILDVNITDCWAHNCHVFLNNSENVSIENCNFEQCDYSVFCINNGTKNTKINNCFASTMGQDPTVPYHLVIFNGGTSYNTIISNILMSGFYGIVNASNGGHNQSNSQLINISGNNNGTNQYSNSKVINCQGYENTPELNEIRRVDGVAKYWDGSAWQAM